MCRIIVCGLLWLTVLQVDGTDESQNKRRKSSKATGSLFSVQSPFSIPQRPHSAHPANPKEPASIRPKVPSRSHSKFEPAIPLAEYGLPKVLSSGSDRRTSSSFAQAPSTTANPSNRAPQKEHGSQRRYSTTTADIVPVSSQRKSYREIDESAYSNYNPNNNPYHNAIPTHSRDVTPSDSPMGQWQMETIQDLWNGGMTKEEIAKSLKVDRDIVERICENVKLAEEQVKQIQNFRELGMNYQDIAKSLRINESLVRKICNKFDQESWSREKVRVAEPRYGSRTITAADASSDIKTKRRFVPSIMSQVEPNEPRWRTSTLLAGSTAVICCGLCAGAKFLVSDYESDYEALEDVLEEHVHKKDGLYFCAFCPDGKSPTNSNRGRILTHIMAAHAGLTPNRFWIPRNDVATPVDFGSDYNPNWSRTTDVNELLRAFQQYYPKNSYLADASRIFVCNLPHEDRKDPIYDSVHNAIQHGMSVHANCSNVLRPRRTIVKRMRTVVILKAVGCFQKDIATLMDRAPNTISEVLRRQDAMEFLKEIKPKILEFEKAGMGQKEILRRLELPEEIIQQVNCGDKSN